MGDKPTIWNGGGCYLSGRLGFLLMLILGYLRAEKRPESDG